MLNEPVTRLKTDNEKTTSTTKKIIAISSILGIAIIAIVILFSMRNTDSPTLVVGNFIIAVKDSDYETASKYLTNETSKVFADYQFDKLRDFFEPDEGVTLPEPDLIDIDGNVATETVIKHDLTNGSEEMRIELRKNFFGWKIESINY